MACNLEGVNPRNITSFVESNPRTLYTYFQSSEMTFGVESIEPGSLVPIHEHPISEEMLFCTKGSGFVRMEQDGEWKQFDFVPGVGVLVPKQTQHSIINASDTEQLWLTYTLVPPQPNKMFASTKDFVPSPTTVAYE